MSIKKSISQREQKFETENPVLMTLLTNMTYDDAKLLTSYKKWHII